MSLDSAKPSISYDSEEKATVYTKIPEQPWMKYLINQTLDKTIGSVEGLRVLDIGCGEGYLSRKLVDNGAIEVLGVDVTPSMIDLAKASSKDYPQTSYSVILPEPAVLGKSEFDMALSSFVLHYSDSYDQLLKNVKLVHMNLKEGGYFCGVATIIMQKYFETSLTFTERAITKSSRILTSLDEFAPQHVFFNLAGDECGKDDHYGSATHDPDESKCFRMDYNVLSEEAFKKALTEVGFKRISRVPITLSEEGMQFYKEDDLRNMDWCYFFRAWKE